MCMAQASTIYRFQTNRRKVCAIDLSLMSLGQHRHHHSPTSRGVYSTHTIDLMVNPLVGNEYSVGYAACWTCDESGMGQYYILCLKKRKKFENWLRFDKVRESLKVGTFLRHSV